MSKLLEDEAPAVRNARVTPFTGRQVPGRGRVEPGGGGPLDQMAGQRRVAGPYGTALGHIGHLGDGKTGLHPVQLLLGEGLVPHGVAPVEGELRQQRVVEDLLVVTADHDQDVQLGGHDPAAQLLDVGAAGRVTAAAHLQCALVREAGARSASRSSYAYSVPR